MIVQFFWQPAFCGWAINSRHYKRTGSDTMPVLSVLIILFCLFHSDYSFLFLIIHFQLLSSENKHSSTTCCNQCHTNCNCRIITCLWFTGCLYGWLAICCCWCICCCSSRTTGSCTVTSGSCTAISGCCTTISCGSRICQLLCGNKISRAMILFYGQISFWIYYSRINI